MSVQKAKLIDVWNVDPKPFKVKQKIKQNKKVQDLKEYFEFLSRWPNVSLNSKRYSERVNKSFILD